MIHTVYAPLLRADVPVFGIIMHWHKDIQVLKKALLNFTECVGRNKSCMKYAEII